MPTSDRPRLTIPPPHPETWVLSLAFVAADEARARTIAGYAAQRLADFLPGFDKNMIAIAREADPGLMLPLYCDQDIYCCLTPGHEGACRDINGTNLDNSLGFDDSDQDGVS